MRGAVVGIASALLLPFAVSGVVSLVDNFCFPDLVNENMGYYFLGLLRLGPLLFQSGLTGCVVGLLVAHHPRPAGWVGLLGGGVAAAILVWLVRSEFSSYAPGTPASIRLRYGFFEWGESLTWAVAIVVTGLVSLVSSGRQGTSPAPPASDNPAWPPPPKPPP